MFFLLRTKWIYIIFVIGFAALALSGKCQRTLSQQAIKAIELFENMQYDISAEQFRRLMARFPEDPLYRYYYAACLIELNQEIDVAIELLKSSLNQYPMAEGYYYLGLAYFRQFRWDDARMAFTAARSSMNSRTRKSNHIVLAESQFDSRIERIKKPEPLLGKVNASFPYDSMMYHLQKFSQLQIYPVQYNQQIYTGIVVNQKSNDSIKMVYFSAPGKQGNFNIFRQVIDIKTRRIRIEELDAKINTENDEILPVYDPVQQLLYFASNRPTGLGGYDLYRCKLDNSGRPVGTAQPLSFPINTPWNDYVFIPVDSTAAYLVSDRASRFSVVTLYQLTYNASLPVSTNRDDLLDCCFFRSKFAAPSIASITTAIKITRKDIAIGSNVDERMLQIKNALVLQRTIDSLQIHNLMLREKLDVMPNDDNRKALYAQWKKNDNEIKNRQNEVNGIYAKLISSNNQKATNNDTVSMQSRINQFVINDQPVYSAENPIPEQLNFPAGVIYTIQLGVFSKKVDPTFFGGIQPIVAEFLNDKKLIKYYAGVFSDYKAADSSLQIVKKAGFKEAFIVSYYDNKKIPLTRAQELEKAGIP